MRWDHLRLTPEPATDDPDAPLPLPLAQQGATVRTIDTPEFRGVTFYEIRAKTILNRVPGESRMPFRWTVNPYRGCTHACTYCLAGETPILMADGTTRRLADLKVGDAIYGTERRGAYRRYVKTEVLAHWSTVKPAYRVTLEDGTRLVASGDHRFLTERGWKHVTAETGCRPHLTTEDALLGVGGAFLRTTDPTVVRKQMDDGVVGGTQASSAVVSVEALGVERRLYDITTGTGDFVADGVISHNCFARKTHTYLDLDAGHDFDSRIVVKVNAGEALRRELGARSWQGEHIAMGTNVDPYQRAEGRYVLMRGILEALRDHANPFSILTKGTLVLRDIDLLTEAARVTDVRVNVSVGFVDAALWRQVESGTPNPRARLGVCRALTDAGIGCGVLMAPILPWLTDSDEQLEATVAAIAEAGADAVTPLVLHLRPGAREWYLGWLRGSRPDLVERYRQLYRNGAYAPGWYTKAITARVGQLAQQYGIGARAPRASRLTEQPVTEPAAIQLTLI